MKQSYSHLDAEKRKLILEWRSAGKTPGEIAERLGVHLSTVYREIKRGTAPQTDEYDPDYAERRYQVNLSNKGKTPCLEENTDMALAISKLIREEGLSPEEAIKKLKRDTNLQVPSKPTVYAAIDRGIIPDVSRETLHAKSTSVFSNGLLHLPKWVREKLNIKDGDELLICLEDETIILRRAK